MYLYSYICNEKSPNFEDAPHGSAILNEESMKFRGCSARERDFRQNFQDAPHRNAILSERTMKFCGCSARERDFLQNFQDAPHRSAFFFKIYRMLRTGARFSSKSTGCSALQKKQDAPHGSAIFLNKFSMLPARERDFLQNFKDTSHGSAIFFKTRTKKTSSSRAV